MRSLRRNFWRPDRWEPRVRHHSGGRLRGIAGQLRLQSFQERPLLGVDSGFRFVQREEYRLIDFPRGATRFGVGGRRTREGVDPLAALRVLDGAECHEVAGKHARFLERFAAGCGLQRFVRIGEALGDAPGGVTVVAAGRMDQKHFDPPVAAAVEQGSCGLLHSDGLRGAYVFGEVARGEPPRGGPEHQ